MSRVTITYDPATHVLVPKEPTIEFLEVVEDRGLSTFTGPHQVLLLKARKHWARILAAAPTQPIDGCDLCGIKGLHACLGKPMKEWTPEEIAHLDAVLAEYKPAAPPLDGYQHDSHSAEHVGAVLGVDSDAIRMIVDRDTPPDNRDEVVDHDISGKPITRGDVERAAPVCPTCHGAKVVGTPGMPCPFCPISFHDLHDDAEIAAAVMRAAATSPLVPQGDDVDAALNDAIAFTEARLARITALDEAFRLVVNIALDTPPGPVLGRTLRIAAMIGVLKNSPTPQKGNK